jgi:hypothetical protein
MPKTLPLIPMKTRISAIGAIYASAAQDVIRALSALDAETYTAAKAGSVLFRVQEIIGRLDARVKKWGPAAIRAAYQESAGVSRTRLEIMGARKLPDRKYDPAKHDKKIDALTKTVMTDYWQANRTIERTARKYISVSGQAAAGVKKLEAKIEQMQAFDSETVKSFINRTVAGSLRAATKYNAGMAHLTSKDIAAKIRAKLLAQLEGQDFITINGRSYNLRSYSELVARTRMRESQTEATKELCTQYDNDLVQFSEHDDPCEDCASREGKIFSLSGKTPGYPVLAPEDEPPIHPHCEHNLNPTSENALAWRARG